MLPASNCTGMPIYAFRVKQKPCNIEAPDETGRSGIINNRHQCVISTIKSLWLIESPRKSFVCSAAMVNNLAFGNAPSLTSTRLTCPETGADTALSI